MGVAFDLSKTDIDVVAKLFELFSAKLSAEENLNNHRDGGRSLSGCPQYGGHKTGLKTRLEAITTTINEHDPVLVEKAMATWEYLRNMPTDAPELPSAKHSCLAVRPHG